MWPCPDRRRYPASSASTQSILLVWFLLPGIPADAPAILAWNYQLCNQNKTTPSLGQRKAVRDFLYTVFLTENLLIRSMNCGFWRIGLKRCTKNAEKVDKRGKYRYYICADNGKAGVCQHSIFWWIRSVKKQPERIFICLQAHNRAYPVSHRRRLPIDTDWPHCSKD